MTWVDYLLGLIVVASVFSGLSAGFARVGIGTAATFIGIFAGFWCYGIVAAHFVDYVSSQAIANLIGFFLAKGWNQVGLWERASMLIGWWPGIVAVASDARPSQLFDVPFRHRKADEVPTAR